MSALEPALDPQYLARLQRLTEAYARYARQCAGLGTALGGVCAWVILVVDLGRHGWRWAVVDALGPHPARSLLILAGLPFLWLGGKELIRRRWYQKYGCVESLENDADSVRYRRKISVLGPLLGLAPLGVLWVHGGPDLVMRGLLIGVLMAGLTVLLPRHAHGKLERMVGGLLFFLPAFMVAGVQMAAGSHLIAGGVGLGAIGMGVREHLAYRALECQLAQLRVLA